MELTEHWVVVRGLRVCYVRAGTHGAPVMLLHGGGIDSALLSWGATIGPLATHHQVFALDWPGYGASDRPDILYRTEGYIDILHDLLDALGLDRVSLVGLSMGGGIALGLTLRTPARVERLVLVDSYGIQPTAPLHHLSYLLVHMPLLNSAIWAATTRSRALARASLRVLFADPCVLSPELEDAIMGELRRPHAGRAFRSLQHHEIGWHAVRTNYLAQLHQITTPTLIVHGADDRLVPLACARRAQRLIAGATLHVIASCGHWPQRERTEEFNRIVTAFLAIS